MMKPGRLLASAAVAGLLAFAAAPANAVTTATCTEAGIQNNLLANGGCQVGEGTSGNVDGLVNDEDFFGTLDWTNVGKEDSGVFGGDGLFGTYNLNFVGDLLAGDWFINGDIWLDYADVMIVLKDGNSAEPGAFIGYLLVSADVDGTYTSPFCNIVTNTCTGGDIKDISFGGLYARGDGPPEGPPEIPLPAALPIFLITLGGAALFARRRRPA